MSEHALVRHLHRAWMAAGAPEDDSFRSLRRAQARAGLQREPHPLSHGGRRLHFWNLVTLIEDLLAGRELTCERAREQR